MLACVEPVVAFEAAWVRLVRRVMMTSTTLLLCAGTAASLVAVWMLSGLSERSATQVTSRVLGVGVLGLSSQAAVYFRTPADARSELALPLFLAAVCVLSLAAGAAKIEAALAERNGARVVRRAAGIVSGTWIGMTAIGATSLGLSSSSLAVARVGWSLMFGLVLAALIAFAARARYAGVGFLSLGVRALVPALAGVALVVGARSTAAQAPVKTTVAAAAPRVDVVTTSEAPSPPPSLVVPAIASTPSEPPAVPSVSASAPTASAVPASDAAAVSIVGVQIEALSTRAIFEADVRGGIGRRAERLQACIQDPNNQQHGSLSLKVGVDAAGSVSYSRAMGGELVGTPLGTCLLGFFYKVGFAAPASGNAHFEITLRVP